MTRMHFQNGKLNPKFGIVGNIAHRGRSNSMQSPEALRQP
jgi:hypothetical protein